MKNISSLLLLAILLFCSSKGFAQGNINGSIQNELGANVEHVKVTLNGEINQTITTDETGQYTFTNLPAGDYNITLEKQIASLNGVSTLDVVLVIRHILGVRELDSPYKTLAADVNSDGFVTSYDVVKMRQLIVGMIPEFNTSWKFIDKSIELPDSPYASIPNPTSYELTLTGNESKTIDFVGIKVGDVSENAIASE